MWRPVCAGAAQGRARSGRVGSGPWPAGPPAGRGLPRPAPPSYGFGCDDDAPPTLALASGPLSLDPAVKALTTNAWMPLSRFWFCHCASFMVA